MNDPREVAAEFLKWSGNVFAWCAVRCYTAARSLKPQMFDTSTRKG